MAQSEKEKLKALTQFIGDKFGVGPGQQEFENIANNMLGYFQQASQAGFFKKANDIAGEGKAAMDASASPDMNNRRREFTLSVNEDGNTSALGRTRTSFQQSNLDLDESTVPILQFELHRDERFVISRDQLSSNPVDFDAEANLLSVQRSDAFVHR